jgi:cobalt-zinc-cadmium efflux system protein
MLHAGSGLIRASGRIFLEAAPAGLDPAALGAAMAARPHVAEVHDLHIWEITTGMPAASAHVLVEPRQDCHAVRADLEELLSHDYGITHLTLQVDHLVAPDSGRPAADGTASPQPAGPHLTGPDRTGHDAEDLHLATHSHCEDSHGPAYRPPQ